MVRLVIELLHDGQLLGNFFLMKVYVLEEMRDTDTDVIDH